MLSPQLRGFMACSRRRCWLFEVGESDRIGMNEIVDIVYFIFYFYRLAVCL